MQSPPAPDVNTRGSSASSGSGARGSNAAPVTLANQPNLGSSRSLWSAATLAATATSALKHSRMMHADTIRDAFSVFDPTNSGTTDPSNLGCIIRSLKLNPSQTELSSIISSTIEPDGQVKLEKLQEKLIPIMQENKMKKESEQVIRRAFEAIDMEKKGFIEQEKLSGLLTSVGEPFSPEEIEEMFSVAVDTEKGVIIYENFAAVLARD